MTEGKEREGGKGKGREECNDGIKDCKREGEKEGREGSIKGDVPPPVSAPSDTRKWLDDAHGSSRQ